MRRFVALKLIKHGADSKQVLARFEAEQQALALMDHPNIARVLDAGTTENGQPFFVMELVRGVPITQYCDDVKLSLRDRLKLFMPVCHAVQHAHQKGIIHRDLKPSNVLVALFDGQPVPKVIDFGLAKAMQHPLTDLTLITEMGMVMGTPEYMAPEQPEVNPLDVDTRADIYSLGVILYELLTGGPPFDRRKLPALVLLELVRLVREEEPPPPSKGLSSIATLGETASRRQSDAKSLPRQVRGELDWIAMKCLEKDRNRRYETANGLAADLERYLNDEPVTARPPSRGYRIRKLVRRNKGLVAGLAAVFLALVLGGAVAAWGWWETNQAVRRADTKALEAENEVKAAIVANAELLAVADERQFALSFPKIAARSELAIPPLLAILETTIAGDAKDEEKERLAKQKANAAVVLLRMNRPDMVWPLLKHQPDPRLRSYLIHRLGPLGVDPKVIVARFDVEPEVSIRRALILSLGEFSESQISADLRQTLLMKLQSIYRSDPDAGMHAAAEWLLRVWKQEAWLKQMNEDWAKNSMASGGVSPPVLCPRKNRTGGLTPPARQGGTSPLRARR